MTDRIESFRVGDSPRVVAATRRGDIAVVIGEPGTVQVRFAGSGADGFDVNQLGDRITVESRRRGLFGSSIDIILTVPTAAGLELSCTSGDIVVQGDVEELKASVASGDVRAGTIRSACRVNSASGDIRVDSVRDAEINTASGDVRLGRVEQTLRLNSASGDVYVGEVGESATFKVASSTVRVACLSGSELRYKSMSGDLVVGIPQHRTIELDFTSLSGQLRNRLPAGDGSPSEKVVTISVNAVSGDLTLRGATR
jgi:DUF4097 and DUF4098 domain-containing protein YvlB